MNDPPRLLEVSDDPLLRELLASAARERPSAALSGHVERAAVAALVAGGAATAIGLSAGAAAAAGAAPVVGGKSVGAVLVTWIGIGALAGGALPGASTVVQRVSDQSAGRAVGASNAPRATAPSVVPERRRAAGAAAEGESTPPAAAPSAALAVAEGVAGRVAPALSARPAVPTSTAASSGAALQREIEAIDSARRALEAGEPQRALESLRGHVGERGALAPEAELLRAEAWAASGDQPRARAAARLFLARHADSPLAPRARKLLGEKALSP